MSKYPTGTTWKAVDGDGVTAFIWLAQKNGHTYNGRNEELWRYEILNPDGSVLEKGDETNRGKARFMASRFFKGNAFFNRCTVEHD